MYFSVITRIFSKEQTIENGQYSPKTGFSFFLVNDVITSGETLEELRTVFKIDDFSCLITVVLNPFILKKLRGIDRIIYGSNQISLPILSKENLPDTILFAEYDSQKS